MKTMRKKVKTVLKAVIFIIPVAIVFFTTSCKKHESCFDKELYYLHVHDYCSPDCPGVLGCDGKTYCNACEAQKVGIRVSGKQ